MKGKGFPYNQESISTLIAEQRQSGLSQSQFCKQKGIHQSTFNGWIRREQKSQESSFLKVVAPTSVKLIFANGMKLEFASPPEPKWLLELMRAAA